MNICYYLFVSLLHTTIAWSPIMMQAISAKACSVCDRHLRADAFSVLDNLPHFSISESCYSQMPLRKIQNATFILFSGMVMLPSESFFSSHIPDEYVNIILAGNSTGFLWHIYVRKRSIKGGFQRCPYSAVLLLLWAALKKKSRYPKYS